ncbi:MAG: UDP-N-acetylmuramoyl-L-alanyl-D-glutamate--2,6-diaminopimelate ligase, partial [Rhodoferax sp.]|nr:UDP-N-acetylmuramoyl-L-alanyl-D-glutamate--2,6-diaminopimelate ligase [Rhodoferax sp.]
MQELHTPQQAAQWLQARVTSSRLSADSRSIAPGDGFIAWPGAAVDARRFVHAARSEGAAACLVEQIGLEAFDLSADNLASYRSLKADTGRIAAAFYGAPSGELAAVAVTGTNGKTSTVWWLAQALSALPGALALPCGVVGTLGVGRPLAGQVVATGLTTPDPVCLQHTLRQMVADGLQAVAMEASSIGIEERRLEGTSIAVAVFTNLTQDHLDYHGSMDAYWQAKRKLFAWPGLRSAVVNLDDPYGERLANELTPRGLDLWTVSQHRSARLQARHVTYSAHGLAFEVFEPGLGTHRLQSRVIGSYNVSNLLGVIAAMRALGVPLDAAVDAASGLQAVPGRMECLSLDAMPLVAVDYAHTPDALGQVLLALRPLAQQRGGKLWCIFGCGGDRDASKRPLMGAIAVQKSDRVVVTSDNPRSEKPEAIVAQVLLGVSHSPTAAVQVDRAQAIADTIAQAAAADVILLAGKGHEETQEIAGIKRAFSDKVHALQALQARAER